jgi:hypothetical protein
MMARRGAPEAAVHPAGDGRRGWNGPRDDGRAFKALEKEGAIKLDRHRIVVLSRTALARLL